jgi:hypothetical protein
VRGRSSAKDSEVAGQTKADVAGTGTYSGANNERGGGGAQESGKASLDKADRGELSNIVSLVREK